MDISVNKLLEKIEAELQAAKTGGSEAKIREHTYAIKAMCELILEEPSTVRSNRVEEKPTLTPSIPTTYVEQPSQKRMKIDDDQANGDSIFDF